MTPGVIVVERQSYRRLQGAIQQAGVQHKTLAFVVEGEGYATTASGPLALNRPRYWEVEADRLTLTTKDENGKPLSIGRWRRMR